MNRILRPLVMVTCATLIAAACGGTAPAASAPAGATTAASSAAASGPDALYAAAKAEGTVVWQDGLQASEAEPVIKAFQAKYPGIDVKHTEISGTDSRERIYRELSAGVVNVDVFDVSGEDIPTLKKSGLLEKYDWTALFTGVKKEQLDPDQMLLAVGGSVHGIGYNTKLVTGNDIPKRWEDLLDPKWKGKLVVDSRPKTFTAIMPAWGEQKTLDFVKALAAQKPTVRRGQTQSITLMGAGDFPMIAGTYNHSLYQVKITGAPVDIVLAEPVPLTLDQEAMPKGLKHPNAAKLFLGWLATDGAKAYDDATYRGIPLPGFDTRPSKAIGTKQVSMFVGEWTLRENDLQKKVLDAMGIKQ